MVGQRGVRVSTVMSELGGEKIDIIEWSATPSEFIEDALSPAQVMNVKIVSEPNAELNERGHAVAEVASDQQSLAIGRGGQNVRLAAKLTGWKIDIVSAQSGEALAGADAEGTPVEAKSKTVIEELFEEDTASLPATEDVVDEPTTDRDATVDADEMDEVDTPEEAEALVNEEAEAAIEEKK